jgi:hypothetical protein
MQLRGRSKTLPSARSVFGLVSAPPLPVSEAEGSILPASVYLPSTDFLISKTQVFARCRKCTSNSMRYLPMLCHIRNAEHYLMCVGRGKLCHVFDTSCSLMQSFGCGSCLRIQGDPSLRHVSPIRCRNVIALWKIRIRSPSHSWETQRFHFQLLSLLRIWIPLSTRLS